MVKKKRVKDERDIQKEKEEEEAREARLTREAISRYYTYLVWGSRRGQAPLVQELRSVCDTLPTYTESKTDK